MTISFIVFNSSNIHPSHVRLSGNTQESQTNNKPI